jgi:hypothetical protein
MSDHVEPEIPDGDALVPLYTQQMLVAKTGEFKSRLYDRALIFMSDQRSRTLTERNVVDAYDELTAIQSSSRLRRCVGDGTMIVGGIFLPLGDTHWLLSLAGVALVAAGLYIREWNK